MVTFTLNGTRQPLVQLMSTFLLLVSDNNTAVASDVMIGSNYPDNITEIVTSNAVEYSVNRIPEKVLVSFLSKFLTCFVSNSISVLSLELLLLDVTKMRVKVAMKLQPYSPYGPGQITRELKIGPGRMSGLLALLNII